MPKGDFMSNKSSVGIVKEIDRLGRICIPKEIRELFNLENQVELVITADGVLVRNPSFRLVRRTSAVNKSKV